MREMDHRIWNEHHDQFSEWLDNALKAGAARLRNVLPQLAAIPRQLLIGAAALGLTALTFGGSIA